jgi:PDZ-binding kinase
MEACTTSLGDILEKRFGGNQGPLEPSNITIMGFDVSKALNYLHNEALLLHGDMKSFNVLVKGDFAICKLCDFGVSLPLTPEGKLDLKKRPAANYVGTELWNAPETFEEDETLISTKSEIFSFGLVIYECIALCPPHTLSPFPKDSKKALDFDDTLEDDDEEDEIDYMVGTRPEFAQDMNLSDDYNDILEIFHMCTNDEPQDRADAKELENIFGELKNVFIL